jgi:hypothetical protein
VVRVGGKKRIGRRSRIVFGVGKGRGELLRMLLSVLRREMWALVGVLNGNLSWVIVAG